MDERECLVKAQEAEAIANAIGDPRRARRWDDIAHTYRRLAREAVDLRRVMAAESY